MYHGLDPAASEIRLMRMLPNENGNELCTEIIHYWLHHAPAYIYLSYIWGDMSGFSDPERLYIGRERYGFIELRSSDLATALRQLNMQGSELHIWVDYICINQADMEEKRTQIALMKDISASARQTIIWLGPSNDDSDTAMTCLKRWVEEGTHPLHDYCIAPLLSRPYWTRIWAFQDIFLPNEIHIRCGSISIPLQKFVQFVIYCTLNILSTLRTLPATMKTPAFHILRHWQELKSAIDGGTCSLLRLLAFTANYLATDPRDRVIALLALASKEDQQQIVPDYSKSVEHFYTEVMRHLIARHGILPLYLLHKWTDEDDSTTLDLRSWVVDWSAHPPTYTGLAFDGVESRNAYRACRTEISPNIRFLPGDILTLEGSVYAEIGTCFPFPQVDGGGSITLWYKQTLKWISDRDRHSQNGTLENFFWRTIVADRVADFSDSLPEVDWDIWRKWLEDPSADKELSKEEGKSLPATEFWELVKDRIRHRVFAVTQHGHMCLVPKQAQPGDALMLFKGGEVPFVLRPRFSAYWGIIGEAYLHGIMYRELAEDLLWRDISIV